MRRSFVHLCLENAQAEEEGCESPLWEGIEHTQANYTG